MKNIDKLIEELDKETERISRECDVISVCWTPKNKTTDIYKYDYVVEFIALHKKEMLVFGSDYVEDLIKNLKEIKTYDDIWKMKIKCK